MIAVDSLVRYRVRPGRWRADQLAANAIVRCVKNMPLPANVTIRFDGIAYRYRSRDRWLLMASVVRRLAERVAAEVGPDAVLVPVPNSSAVRGLPDSFATGRLAAEVAGAMGPKAAAAPLLRWQRQVPPSRLSGDRRVVSLFDNLVLVGQPDATRPLVLLDDVMTTGSHLVACFWRLADAGASPVRAVVVARSVGDPDDDAVGWASEGLSLFMDGRVDPDVRV